MPEPLDAPLAVAWERHLDRRRPPVRHPGAQGLHRAGRAGGRRGRPALRRGRLDAGRPPRRSVAPRRRRPALWGADWCRFSVAGSTHGNQAHGAGRGVARATWSSPRGRCTARCCWASCSPACRPVWVQPDDRRGLRAARWGAGRAADGRAGRPPGGARGLRRRAGLRRRPLRRRRAGTRGARGRRTARRRPGLGCPPRVPSRTAAARARVRRGRLRDQRAQGAAGLHPGGAGAARGPSGSTATGSSGRSRRRTRPARPGTIIASIDAARALLARDGERLLGRTIAPGRRGPRAARARCRDWRCSTGPATVLDPTRLVVGLAGTGADGLDVEDDLDALGFAVEMADRDTIVATVTMADTEDTVGPFVDALVAAIETSPGRAHATWCAPCGSVRAARRRRRSPRGRRSSPRTRRSAPTDAAGRVAAELVAPYPPGIPAVVPGEVLTAEVLDALRAAAARGVRVAYAADPTMATRPGGRPALTAVGRRGLGSAPWTSGTTRGPRTSGPGCSTSWTPASTPPSHLLVARPRRDRWSGAVPRS